MNSKLIPIYEGRYIISPMGPNCENKLTVKVSQLDNGEILVYNDESRLTLSKEEFLWMKPQFISKY